MQASRGAHNHKHLLFERAARRISHASAKCFASCVWLTVVCSCLCGCPFCGRSEVLDSVKVCIQHSVEVPLPCSVFCSDARNSCDAVARINSSRFVCRCSPLRSSGLDQFRASLHSGSPCIAKQYPESILCAFANSFGPPRNHFRIPHTCEAVARIHRACCV